MFTNMPRIDGASSSSQRLWRVITSRLLERVAAVDFLARGASWALILVLSVTTAVVAATSFMPTRESFISNLATGIALATSAFGGSVHLVASDWSSDTFAETYFSFAMRPTLLTLIVATVGYRFGKRSFIAGLASKASSTGFLLTSFGFAGSLWAVSWVTQSQVSALTLWSARLEPMTVLDVFLTAGFVFGLCKIGYASASEEINPSNSLAAWARSVLFHFAKLYSLLVLLSFVVVLIYWLVEPDFGVSKTVVEGEPADWKIAAAAGFAVLLYIPSLVISALGIAMGGFSEVATVGDFSALFGSLSEWLGRLFNLNVYGGIFTFGGVWFAGGILLLVFITALVVGSAVATSKNVSIHKLPQWSISALWISGLGAVVAWLVRGEVALTNDGAPQIAAKASTLTLSSGSVAVGLSAISVIGVLLGVSIAAGVGSGIARGFAFDAFPRISHWLGAPYSEEVPARGVLARLFGIFVSTAIVGAIVVPIGVVSAERLWAMRTSPAIVADGLVTRISEGDLGTPARLFDLKEKKSKWLSEAILKSALPSDLGRYDLEINNGHGDAWSVGQSDANGFVKWATDHGQVVWPVSFTSEMENRYKIVDHVVYTAEARPVVVSISAGPRVSESQLETLRINGEKAVVGRFLAVPGVYHVTMAPDGFIAGTNEWLPTTGLLLKIEPGTKVSLPSDANPKLLEAFNSKIAVCSKVNDQLESKCFSTDDVLANLTYLGGNRPDTYWTYKFTDKKASQASCKSLDSVISATKMTRSYQCKLEVKFGVDFLDFSDGLIGKGKYETYVDYVVVVKGKLTKSGEFVAEVGSVYTK